MKNKTIFWTIFPAFSVLFGVFLLGYTLYSYNVSKKFYLQTKRADLETYVKLIAKATEKNDTTWVEFCRSFWRLTDARVTVINIGGQVLGDSHEDFSKMDNHKERPEIINSLSEKFGHATRYSNTLNKDMMYAASVVEHEAGKLIIRVAVSLTELEGTLRDSRNKIIGVGGLGLIFVLLLCLLLSRSISNPIEKLRRGVVLFAQGKEDDKLYVRGTQEIDDLNQAFNDMRARLNNRIEVIQRQQSELDAIFNGMSEAVLALNDKLELITCNPQAAILFNIDLQKNLGSPLYEFVRNNDLRSFMADVFESNQAKKIEIDLYQGEYKKNLQFSGTPLHKNNNELQGIILVVNDLTQLKQLESVREEFVANVSHELKTPITTIKGAGETLAEGALNDPEHAPKFVKMITENSDRLARIVEDIMQLARLEGDMKSGELEKSTISCPLLLNSALKNCELAAKPKNIHFEVSSEPNHQFQGNLLLMEQALINLLNNAIKYSPEGTLVILRSRLDGDVMNLEVQDHGPGIPANHLSRLFERFYRVDKARSRKLGGTGLGLAIVKHTCQLHGGSVSVTSEVGKGSTFTISIPV